MTDFRLQRQPECDQPERACWLLEKRRPIFGWNFVSYFYFDPDAAESEVVEFAMNIALPRAAA